MNSMNPRIVKTNIKAFKVLADAKVPFGRQIEVQQALKAWKEDGQTKSTWISQKRKSLASALREFRDLYEAGDYFASFGKNDDSFQVFYRH